MNQENGYNNVSNVDVGQMDAASQDYATSAVPLNKRRSFWGTTSVWVGWCISLSAFLTGGTIGAGCTLWMGLLAVLAGNLLLALIGSLVGIIGFRSGTSTYVLFEGIFGTKGSVLASVIRGISAMSFIGVLLDSFANSLTALLPWFPRPVAIFLFAGAILYTSIRGFKGLEWLSKIAVPALWVLLALSLYMTFTRFGSNLLTWQPEEPISFITAMGAAVATWIAGAGMTPDLTRYSKRSKHVWGGALVGYVLGSGLFEAAAVISAIGAGNGNLVVVMSNLGLLIPAVIVLGLALWTTTDNNVYSTSLAFSNAAKILNLKVSRTAFCLISVAIAVAVSFLGLARDFSIWLSFTGSLAGPLAGMMIAHYLVLNVFKNKFFVPGGIRISAYIAWIISGVGAQFTSSPIPSVMAIIFGFVSYTILFYILDIRLNLNKDKEMDVTKGKIWHLPSSKEMDAAIAAAEAAEAGVDA